MLHVEGGTAPAAHSEFDINSNSMNYKHKIWFTNTKYGLQTQNMIHKHKIWFTNTKYKNYKV